MTDTDVLTIDYRPRTQFIPFHNRTERFACIVAHRRAGKTVACIHDLQRAAWNCPKDRPRFAYIAPYLKQSKSVAWDYLKDAAVPLMALGAEKNESELRIDYPNGGQVRLYGADNPDALRGIYLDGVVLDEFADMDPRIWEAIRPALSDRNGWATFIGTPRGHNSFYDFWQRAQTQAGWFPLILRASETGILPAEELHQARNDLNAEQYEQEYECSFEAAILGAYYAPALNIAQADKRITGVPYDPSVPVWTGWDLGMRDATAIWFAQIVGREVHLIDYYEASGVDLGHYVRELKNRPYVYERHLVPHDAQARELGTGKSRLEILNSLGLNNVRVVTQHRIEDGINGARLILPKCWFDAEKCARGLEALKIYRAEQDPKFIDPATRQPILKPHPVHDWSSHAADAFRYLAMGLDDKGEASGFYKPINYPKIKLV